MIELDEARQYYQGSDAIHDFDHVLRVLALAERLAQVEGLIASVMLVKRQVPRRFGIMAFAMSGLTHPLFPSSVMEMAASGAMPSSGSR